MLDPGVKSAYGLVGEIRTFVHKLRQETPPWTHQPCYRFATAEAAAKEPIAPGQHPGIRSFDAAIGKKRAYRSIRAVREPFIGVEHQQPWLRRERNRMILLRGVAEPSLVQDARAEVRADWPRDADAILTASAAAAPQWLRVNARRGTRDAYYTRLVQAGLQAEVPDAMPEALRLAAPVPVDALPGFADGDVSIQDGAAQRVADALRPASGARVLDACAAPGGKSAHLLERDPALRLLAIDIAAPRVARIEQTFARLGIGAQARVRTADALDLARWWDGAPFDAVLLDAPCSATGIVRRQPDVLLHRRPRDLDALVALQAQLLDALATVLAPGGVLLYATCSILRRENAAQVEAFLARHPDFTLAPLDRRFGHDTGAGHQRLPGEGGMDGFFYARLVRSA